MRQRSVAEGGCSVSASAELYSLCQTAAPDGKLSVHELERLGAWLDSGAQRDVPQWPFVHELIAHAVGAGTVTPADLQALEEVLEPGFPQILRCRTAVRFLEGDGTLTADDVQSERAKNEILASARFMVAGCQGEKRGAPLAPRQVRAADPVLLVVQLSGEAASVIEVRSASGRLLGFVPARHAQELAPFLERGGRYRAHLILVSSGVYAPVLGVQAFVYRGDAALGFAQPSARRVAPRQLSRLSWALVRASIALALAAGAALALRV
jgi:hypothetical protein